MSLFLQLERPFSSRLLRAGRFWNWGAQARGATFEVTEMAAVARRVAMKPRIVPSSPDIWMKFLPQARRLLRDPPDNWRSHP